MIPAEAVEAQVLRMLPEAACTCYVTDEKYWFRYGSAVEPGSQLEPNPDCPDHFPLLHSYAAAGFTVCGVQTGGAISRHEGYDGPPNQTTADDSLVTCEDCTRKLSMP